MGKLCNSFLCQVFQLILHLIWVVCNRMDTKSDSARKLQQMVDLTISLIYQTGDDIDFDFQMIELVWKAAKKLFPDKEKLFFMIYFTRFRRVLEEKYGMEALFHKNRLNLKFEEYFGGIENERIH